MIDAVLRLPIGAVFAVTVGLVMLSMLAGYLLGAHRRRRGATHGEGPIASVLGSTLGLLAFVLAITFGNASSRFDARKSLLLEDVNAIATVVRRADILPQPQRTRARDMLKRYVDLRVEATRDPRTMPRVIAQSESLQDTLWSDAASLAREQPSAAVSLYLAGLNQMMAAHTSRTTVALVYRIPTLIWAGLLLLTVFSMAAVGFQFGTAGRGNWILSLGLAAAFAAVIAIIAELDRTSGGIQVNQKPMLDLQRRLGTDVEAGR
jgi:hypothetical protein